jgi:hypothetical protein
MVLDVRVTVPPLRADRALLVCDGGADAVAPTRYMYVDGIEAWYCARMANRSAVGPAGR